MFPLKRCLMCLKLVGGVATTGSVDLSLVSYCWYLFILRQRGTLLKHCLEVSCQKSTGDFSWTSIFEFPIIDYITPSPKILNKVKGILKHNVSSVLLCFVLILDTIYFTIL